MAKKPRKSGAKKRKEPTSSDAAPAGFSPEAQGFDYPAAVKKLQNVKSCVNETEIGKCLADNDEYQSLLLEFLYADLGVVFCLMLLWGAQALSNWWAPSVNPL